MGNIDNSIKEFIEYQQNADKEFLDMEREREGRKEKEGGPRVLFKVG